MDATFIPPTHEQRLRAQEFLEIWSPGAGEGDLDIAAALIARIEHDGARTGIGGNAPPEPLGAEPLPEKLIDPTILLPLFEKNYAALIARGQELAADAMAWVDDHTDVATKSVIVVDEQDNSDTSDFAQQLAGFAGTKGEVEEVRKKIKAPVFEAGKVIDGWAASLRDDILGVLQKMNDAQTAFLRRKADRERREREEAARRAKEEADRAIEEARQAGGDDQKVDAAMDAEARAAEAQAAAAARDQDLVRSRSAMGTTTTLTSKWVWEVESKEALVLAAAGPQIMGLLLTVPEIAGSPKLQADIRAALLRGLNGVKGQVPLDYLAINDKLVNAAIAGKSGRREIPGLRIFMEQKAATRR